MSTLAVIAYPEQGTAAEAAAALGRMQKELLIELEDVAWVTKAQDGKLKLHQGTSLTGAGAAGGAMWGFLVRLALPRAHRRDGHRGGERRAGRTPGRLRA